VTQLVLPLHECVAESITDPAATESVADPAATEATVEPLHSIADPAATAAPIETSCLCVQI
jgi:hypothetical protein